MAEGGSANGYIACTLLGNLAADPELRYTPGGQAVCNFRMAVNQRVPAGGDEWETKAQWFRVTVWGRQAEAVNAYLHKGSKVLVEINRFNFDPATGAPVIFQRQDGTFGANYEVTARTVRFVDPPQAGQNVPEVEEDIVFN